MLNIEKFEATENCLWYEGLTNHYWIFKSQLDGYTLVVDTLDEDGNEHTENYACASISNAIASIEALENGEEI